MGMSMSCTCGNTRPADTDVSLSLTATTISIINSQELSTAIIETILGQFVFFQPSPIRPVADYSAYVGVVASDGRFNSIPATTTVNILFMNQPPQVLVNGMVSRLDYTLHSAYVY